MRIETERLFLREMTEADFDALYTVLGDSDIMEHYPYTFDAAQVKNWITKNQERYIGYLASACGRCVGKRAVR